MYNFYIEIYIYTLIQQKSIQGEEETLARCIDRGFSVSRG